MIRASLRAAEAGVHKLEAALVPGISENELWSHLHQHVIETDGDYVETRLISSARARIHGSRKAARARSRRENWSGFDTDVVGRFGYYADFAHVPMRRRPRIRRAKDAIPPRL